MKLEDTVNVEVETEYLEEQSLPEDDRFVFAYHISITNRGDQGATLRTRHWFIADGNADVQEVKGEGVIGEQPTIEPGETYRYSSGSVCRHASVACAATMLWKRTTAPCFMRPSLYSPWLYPTH